MQWVDNRYRVTGIVDIGGKQSEVDITPPDQRGTIAYTRQALLDYVRKVVGVPITVSLERLLSEPTVPGNEP
jgi:hypothetical protein